MAHVDPNAHNARSNMIRSLFARDAVLRVLWTLVQVAAAYLLTRVTGISAWWAAPIAAGIAVVKSFAASYQTNPHGSIALDVLERVGATAAEAILGLVVVGAIGLPSAYQPIAAAVLAMLKVALAKYVPDTSPSTGSLLPARRDPGAYAPVFAHGGAVRNTPPTS